MLARVQGPLEVIKDVQVSLLDGSILSFNGVLSNNHKPAFEAVDLGCTGPNCDVVLVECGSLTSIDPPPVGTHLSLVQGIFDERDTHRFLFLRGPDDLIIGNPPLAQDAFPVYDNDLAGNLRVDSVEVVFDRAVETTSAEQTGNYSPTSGTVAGAQRLNAPDDNRVVLRIVGAGDDGVVQNLTVANVRSLEDGTAMLSPQTLTFYNGVLELEKVRAPDPGALAGNPCLDKSRYSGPGSTPGLRSAFTGTVTGAFGNLYTLQGLPPQRAGLWVQSSQALTVGRAYLLAGALEEAAGETQGTGLVYVRDLGVASAPAPSLQSVHVLIDETCDAAQLFLTGQDFDGMLVTLDRVVVLGNQAPGLSFTVGTPGTNALVRAGGASVSRVSDALEQILVADLGGNITVPAVPGRIVTVTGVLGRLGGAFVIVPRSATDIVDFGDQPTFSLPFDISKQATASRDPDVVLGHNSELFMAWGRNFHESVHSVSQDNTLNWSSGLPIPHQGVQPAVTVTPSNKFCILASGVEQLFFKQSTDGGFQLDPLITPVDLYPTAYPAVTVGSGEHLHAAWQRTTGSGDSGLHAQSVGGTGIFYSRSLDGGLNFGLPFKIAGDSIPYESNTMARICASKGDSVYVFWQYDLPGEPGVHKVLFSRSWDGGVSFTTPRRVRDEANPLTSTVKLAFLGDAQTGPDGTVYVMGLQDGGPGDSIAFLRTTNGGGKFTLVGHLPNPAPTGLCPKSFIVGPGGTIHALVGICGTALFYTKSTDGGHTWGPLVNVTGTTSPSVGEPRGAKIILGPNGKPAVVWYAPVGGSTEIYSVRQLN